MSATKAQTQLFRAVLIRLKTSPKKLAVRAGRSVATVRGALNGNKAALHPRTTHCIEQALGEAVWSDAETFQYRRDVIKWAGFDPYAIPLRRLYSLLKPFGITLNTHPLKRAAADAAIEAAFDTAQAAKAAKTAKSAKARKMTSLSPTFADTAIAPERTAEGQHSGRGIKTRTRGAQLGQTLRTPTKREHGAPRS